MNAFHLVAGDRLPCGWNGTDWIGNEGRHCLKSGLNWINLLRNTKALGIFGHFHNYLLEIDTDHCFRLGIELCSSMPAVNTSQNYVAVFRIGDSSAGQVYWSLLNDSLSSSHVETSVWFETRSILSKQYLFVFLECIFIQNVSHFQNFLYTWSSIYMGFL